LTLTAAALPHKTARSRFHAILQFLYKFHFTQIPIYNRRFRSTIEMEAIYANASDSSEIRVKLELLHQQEKIIEYLANKLEAAQLEYYCLEAEIKSYQASLSPIQKCPEEVLLIIFESFSKQNPKTVAGLLPVCKQ